MANNILALIEDDYPATEVMWQNMRDLTDILEDQETVSDVKKAAGYEF